MYSITMQFPLYYYFIISIFHGMLNAYFAHKRGRSPRIWFFLGFLFGLFSLLALFLLPSFASKKEEEAQVPAKSEETQQQKFYRMSDWFYLDADHQQQGPVIFESIQNFIHEGNLSDESYVWCEMMSDWKKVKDLEKTIQF